MRYERILVAVDPSGCAVDVCEHAATLAAALHAEVELLHVVHEPPAVPADAQVVDALGVVHGARELLDVDAARELAVLADVFTRVKRTARVRVAHGKPAETILAEARATKASLIVLGTHGRRGARRLIFGSVAEEVVRDAPCPVVVVRAPRGTPDVPSALEQRLAAEADG